MNETLYKTLHPFSKVQTDDEGISVMSAHWPNNFMLQNEDVTGLELSLHSYATLINRDIYNVATMTDANMIELIRNMSALASLMYVYNNDTRLLGGHGDVDILKLRNALIWTADALQRHVVSTHGGSRVASSTTLQGLLSQL